jgi:hypothetical protein
MRRHLLSVAAMGIAFAISAGAQGYYDGPYSGGRDAYGRPYYGDRGWRGPYQGRDVIGQVMADLDRIGAYSGYDRHNRKKVDHAQRELIKFQSKWARGRFDSDPLDEAIDEMKDLAGSDRIGPRERRILMRDIEALRDFRSARGYYRSDRDRRYGDGYRW